MIVVGAVLSKILDVVQLGIVNRLAGGVFGLVRASVFALPILVPVAYFNSELLDASLLVGPIKPLIFYVLEITTDLSQIE